MTTVNPKQYLVMVSDVTMALINKICPGLGFLEVEGMNLKECEDKLVIVTPVPKPVEPAVVTEEVAAPVEEQTA